MDALAELIAPSLSGLSTGFEAFEQYLKGCVGAVLSATDVVSAGLSLNICTLRMKASALGFDERTIATTAQALHGEDLALFHFRMLSFLSVPVFQRESEGLLHVAGQKAVAEFNQLFERTDKCDEHVFSFSLPPTEREFSTLTSDGAYSAEWLSHAADLVDFVDTNGLSVNLEVREGDQLWQVRPWGAPPFAGDAPQLGSRAEVRLPGLRRLQPLHSIAATEPRILLLAHHWALLSQTLRFSDDAGTLEIKGFSLRDNRHWIVSSHGHPSEVYEYLARVCNVSCSFCYLHGNPSGLAIARGAKVATRDELDTRLKYYDPSKRHSLFKAQWEINEFLVDPSLTHVLTELRHKTASTFFFVTNGNPLDERVVDLLARVAPVDLIVSLNATDPILRQKMMQERPGQTAKAAHSLELLRSREIPFGVSIAAFPDVKRSDFDMVIDEANRNDAAFIRVNLPGFTAKLPPDPPFDTEKRWAEVIDWVQEARARWPIPIVSIPSAYETNFHQDFYRGADIWGVIPNSPASIAGLQPGDIITRLGDFEIRSRSELTSLALLLRPPVQVEFVRSGSLRVCRIPAAPPKYPYLRPVFGKYLFPLGIVSAPSLGHSDAMALERVLVSAGCSSPAIITSPLMKGAAARIVDDFLPEWSKQIKWVVAHNKYLGGNIQVLDMATVGDLQQAVDLELNGALRGADLLVVPSSGFNALGRDIVGRHWSDLATNLGMPLATVECQQFLF
ncbi:radical SAM protein [Rhizobium lentis]|uniref:Putative Fe-S cluster-containing radical SAM superfamily protein n=1 Tax=Rhizobium lentis TaxID=1138194 RepID=A0A7W8XKP2_9HYPH|nr:radical SAM protein [Rhizobium lentis]MBB4577128.1 putative Fe-S cluster-containing radical SAM superfamily protein [Rhizobium lentis]MBB5553967.1 putative Fe-S cluster-containing radical SAM superfamily protein [Rhizobium lentis]MBB5564529.1 putative Fe-S cluster-containing radical SAM superfamily protein [Rhizobium lentis]MBB5571045.1 putative Fe-S cluster-containing radical SAM superfamily protein [Rhizobium lentis]